MMADKSVQCDIGVLVDVTDDRYGGQRDRFERGEWRTLSLPSEATRNDVSVKHTDSSASISSTNTVGDFFASFIPFRTKIKKIKSELQNTAKDNEQLREQIFDLHDHISRMEKQNDETERDKVELQKEQAEIKEVLKTYKRKFDDFECDMLQQVYSIGKVSNLNTGSGNIHVHSAPHNDVGELLSQYHENLTKVMQEWEKVNQSLQTNVTLQEQLTKQIQEMKDVQTEVIDAVTKITEATEDLPVELEYTISWTEPRLLAECVDELRHLPKQEDLYKFKDLPRKAKVGVLRIWRKYEKRLSFKRFVQRLDMEAEVDMENMSTDGQLQKDGCASVLVKWVQKDQENDTLSLLDIFPRIKPGSRDLRYREGNIQFNNMYSSDSLSSTLENIQKKESLLWIKEWLSLEFQNGFRTLQTLLSKDVRTAVDGETPKQLSTKL